ncbi:MAG: transcription termination factor Rho [bacterium]|nr:transcription termination factor Rho [bacterium]MBP8310734.1 transcription termination factor Rho [Burkholderiaceae bacterium]
MSDTTTGVLDLSQKGDGFLRNPAKSFQPSPDDVLVPRQAIQKFALVHGATITGPVRAGKRSPQLVGLDAVCGLPYDTYRKRTPFEKLLAVNPDRRFRIGDFGGPTMRIVELFAPIARGTRGLIVAPPRTGKTVMLEELAKAICAEIPDSRVVVLLVDERPEEVTHFRRSVPAEVLASNNDHSIEAHIRLCELTMAQVRCEAECGHDVVLLVDSLTRMARAFNNRGPGSGRTLSGGLDSRAMEIPRKFFGMARNVEGGGSITVIATALIETGSRLDDLIFEEFKGTGNSEIVLDRQMAEGRVFPAINIRTSGTRREELLYTEDQILALNLLRKRAIAVPPRQAMEGMLKLMEKYPTNDALLAGLKSLPGV